MTHATSTRHGHGEDSIYWDATKNRYVGAIDLGLSPAGTRIRKKVRGKTEVRDKLRELHKEIEAGLRPRRRYTVGDAIEDWLANGLDGLSERTVTLYRGTIAKALNEELGPGHREAGPKSKAPLVCAGHLNWPALANRGRPAAGTSGDTRPVDGAFQTGTTTFEQRSGIRVLSGRPVGRQEIGHRHVG